MRSLDLITPSYRGDLERAVLLARSVDRWVDPAIGHTFIVPKRDEAAFRAVLPGRSGVRTLGDLFGSSLVQLPGFRKVYVMPPATPVRGWIVQQLVKLYADEVSDAEVLAFADSDLVFFREWDGTSLRQPGERSVYRIETPPATPRHTLWHEVAADLLGVDGRVYSGFDYISPLVWWHTDTMRQVRERVEASQHRPCARAIAARLHFAEYILYGRFIEMTGVEEWSMVDHTPCRSSWTVPEPDVPTERVAELLVEEAGANEVAINVQSNLAAERWDLAKYTVTIERLADL